MSQIKFYNTLTNRMEPFEPIDPPGVYMYNCGPTVYDYAHIGNFKTLLFGDVLRRFLDLAGYEVHQVMNITDVGHMTEDQLADGGGEDKMQLAARRLKEAKKQGSDHLDELDNPDDPFEVADFYTQRFLEDAKALGMKVADEYPHHMPKASSHVTQMQQMIAALIERDHAYATDDGTVYYSVESFQAYGRLSGNTLSKLRGGAGGRVLDEHQAGKRHPADFLLWKSDPSHIMKWPSPWGTGYPGWHIECSAMAKHVLGRTTIDIHTGGEDNIFPHHECEIAQTCGATGSEAFARFWMHSRHLKVEGQKMSKSKGTFFTLGDLTSRGVDPVVVRYELIKANYRSNINFTFKGLEDSASAVSKIRNVAIALEQQAGGGHVDIADDHPALARFIDALADDLNMAGALAVVFDFISAEHPDPDQALAVVRKFDEVLGVSPTTRTTDDDADSATILCQQLDEARANKVFAAADKIRQELIDAGYDVKTTREGTVATKKLV